MNVSLLALAEFADTSDGKLTLRGIRTAFEFPTVPHALPSICLGCIVGFGISERYEQVQLLGHLIDPEGREVCQLFRYEAILVGPPNDELSLPFWFECRNMVFAEAGDYRVVVSVNGLEMASTPLRAVHDPVA